MSVKAYNPVKKLLLYLTIGFVFLALALAVIFINWILNHIYTVVWLCCVLGCVLWFIYSLVPSNVPFNDKDLTETFDS